MSVFADPPTHATVLTPTSRTSMTSRSVRLLALALAAPIALSGCDTLTQLASKTKPPPCPPIYILSDTAKITKFRPGSGRDLTDVELEAEVVAYKGNCSYDDKGATVEVQVSFDVTRGPASTSRNTELTYFVAIPKFYPAPEAKAEFTFPISFPEGVDQARVNDEDVILHIPVKDREVINNYEIYLGFQATPEELERNRRAKLAH